MGNELLSPEGRGTSEAEGVCKNRNQPRLFEMKERTHNQPEQAHQRRFLRQNSTSAEAVLWNMLKSRQLGVKFRRQFSIGPYILDFYSPEVKLCVELDGASHFTYGGTDYDYERTTFLKDNHGIDVLRFENNMVFKYSEEVVLKIKREVEERKTRED